MNILHFSDIHFERNYPEHGQKDKFDYKEKIFDELIELIAQYMIEDLNNAVFPYMLQPLVTEELQKSDALCVEFVAAYKKVKVKYRAQYGQNQNGLYSSFRY